MNMKELCLAIALLGTAGFAATAAAGVDCSSGSGCKIGKPGSAAKAAQPASGAGQVTSPAPTFYSPPLIAPIWTTPLGQTYGRWAAEWWQWVVGIPADVNPQLDETGEHCAERQVDKVWFLAGSFDPTATVVRKCTVPAGKALFFPLINIGFFAFLNDKPKERTEEFVRKAGSCTEAAQISVWIDGLKVNNPNQHSTGPSRSQSPIFNVQMPPGNILGADEKTVRQLVLSPSAEEGYYLFVWPLKPGPHTIRWMASGCTAGNKQNATYHLNVVK